MDEPGFQSFTLFAALAGGMALIYAPLRLFLTACTRRVRNVLRLNTETKRRQCRGWGPNEQHRQQ